MENSTNGAGGKKSPTKRAIPKSLEGVPGTNIERALETDFSKYIGILKGKFEIKGDIYSTGLKD